MIDIDSGDVIQMRDETLGELLDEVNEKSSQVRMSVAFCWTAIVIGLIAGLAFGANGLVLTLLALPGLAIGRWLDSYRRSTVLYYDLEGDAEETYKQLAQGFDGLIGCAGKWHIEAGGAVTSLTAWKRNAGASHLVRKSATTLSYRLPAVIKSNVTPPALGVGKQTLFFMPDIVLVQDGTRFGAVPYGDLTLRWQDTRFIEEGRVPSDARVVGHTWKHPNRDGGPDRRFRDNRQIPICLYETIHFHSNSGVNELVEFSKTGKAAAFADGCERLSRLPREKTTRASLPAAQSSMPPDALKVQHEARQHRSLPTYFFIPLAIVVGLPMLGILFPNPPLKQDPAAVGEKPNLAAEWKPPVADESRTSVPNTLNQAPLVAAPQSQHASDSPSEDAASVAIAASPPLSSRSSSAVKTELLDVSPAGETKSAVSLTRRARKAVNLREGPSTKNKILVTVPKGAAVKILGQSGGWSHVDFGNGVVGWIASEFLATE
ncbi:SH3 domain-containing protein [Pleomorphomonas sp. NRK KF1]|uniref:SH3 domain-containing protein n=1 Tax=Pleomorphomonas sp. NRK KF1 TaxID=2943000 RepID=UPI002043753D|nr:SH3 domain-containing protein [Pleomorphomonas sp. NRK KF1]MCM5555354.1 SH3 domain-containing protein [Pleomorphomonas sp. NRK KF1]